jgi:hypothetical protein
MHARRHARDYERLIQHSESLITRAIITLMTRRVTRRSPPTQRTTGLPRSPTRLIIFAPVVTGLTESPPGLAPAPFSHHHDRRVRLRRTRKG